MSKYKSAQGKVVDMAALASKNERVRAVGNMGVNARGDTIDSFGRIITPATQRVSDKYAKTVSNPSAQAKAAAKQKIPQMKKPPVDLTPEEIELEKSLDEDIEVEKIKEKETKGK